MKKISILIIAIITSLQINAQAKVGTIDIEYIISIFIQEAAFMGPARLSGVPACDTRAGSRDTLAWTAW